MADPVVFDAGPLWSFAVVDRLDVLEERYGDRARWTVEVHDEINRNASKEPALHRVLAATWLPAPMSMHDIDASRGLKLTHEVLLVQQSLAGPSSHPLEHLGEASAIIAARELGAWVATEDADAVAAAEWRGLTVRWTMTILAESVALGELTCDQVWILYQDMLAAGRRLPGRTKSQVCSGH